VERPLGDDGNGGNRRLRLRDRRVVEAVVGNTADQGREVLAAEQNLGARLVDLRLLVREVVGGRRQQNDRQDQEPGAPTKRLQELSEVCAQLSPSPNLASRRQYAARVNYGG
jgi:hypothetical protein